MKRLVCLAAAVIALGSTAGTAAAASRSPLATGSATCSGAVSWQRAASLVGRVATVTGRVAGTKYASWSNGSPTFLDIGRPYPNQGFTVVIWVEDRGAFGRPEVKYRGHTICVRGLVNSYAGVPQIVAHTPSQIRIAR